MSSTRVYSSTKWPPASAASAVINSAGRPGTAYLMRRRQVAPSNPPVSSSISTTAHEVGEGLKASRPAAVEVKESPC